MDFSMDETQLNDELKLKIQLLVNEYGEKTSTSSSSNDDGIGNGITNSNPDNTELGSHKYFIEKLFKLLLNTKYKDTFVQLKIEYDNIVHKVQNDLFIYLTKISIELFKTNIFYDVCELIIEYTLNHVDTTINTYKIIQLSMLSVCYWKEKKFQESLNCMNLELNLVTHSNDLNNKYRILGNIANAYKLLKNFTKSKTYFKQQLNVSLEIKNRFLTINSLNSLGNIYLQCKEHELALQCFNKSLTLIKKFQETNEAKLDLLIKQYYLVGDCYLKLNMFIKSREIFREQLELLNNLLNSSKKISANTSFLCENNTTESFYLEICKTQLNLGIIEKKLCNYDDCIKIFELTIDYLKINIINTNSKTIINYFKFIDIYFKLYINLINSYLSLNKHKNAQKYTQNLLDFTLKEQNFLHTSKHGNATTLNVKLYLKFIEIYALSKLGLCYEKLNSPENSLKLYEREIKLIKKYFQTNYLLLIRSYMHCANLNYTLKNYTQTIQQYKEILNLIEINCNDEVNNVKNKKLIKLSFYTLTNLAECMKTLGQNENAYYIYKEQYELAKYLNNLKMCSVALLNLINILNVNELGFKQELTDYLFSLNDIYVQLNNLNGQLYIAQLIAYYYHKNQTNLDVSIKFYHIIVDLCKKATSTGTSTAASKLAPILQKTLFNLSLCYRQKKAYLDAYKYQLEYLCLIKLNKLLTVQELDYLEYESLGIVADLLLNINPNNCEIIIKIHVNRLNIIKKYLNTDVTRVSGDVSGGGGNVFVQKRFNFIYDCFESLSKCYYLNEDYDNVFKFKLIQLKLCLKNNLNLVKYKIKILFDLANLLLFKFNNYTDARYYYEYALNVYDEQNRVDKSSENILLVAIIYGNLGICCIKNEDYVNAITYFNKQIKQLDERLDELKSPQVAQQNNDKEIISIYLDKGRALLKLSKCYNSISLDSVNYLNEYVSICDQLYETYIKDSNPVDHKSLYQLYGQIFTDYDLSLNKLSKYYEIFLSLNLKSIDINKKRLFMLDKYKDFLNSINAGAKNTAASNENKIYLNILNLEIELNLIISKLYLNENFLYKSLDYSKIALDLCTNLDYTFYINKYLYIKCLNLNCRLLFRTIEDDDPHTGQADSDNAIVKLAPTDDDDSTYLQNELKQLNNQFLQTNKKSLTQNSVSLIKTILNNSLKSYDLICTLQFNEQQLKYIKKILKLNYEIILNLIKSYKYLKQTSKIYKLLNDFNIYLNDKYLYFNKLTTCQNSQNLIYFIDYLYKINFKLCLYTLFYDNSSLNEANFNNLEIYLLNFKHVYLQKNEFNLKLLKIFYLKACFYKCKKFYEKSLEFYVNSLDLLESWLTSEANDTTDNTNTDDGCVDDNNDYFDVKKLQFIMYDSIIELLILINRLNDALLVCERLRHLNRSINAQQISKETNIIVYYHVLKSNSTINCWLIQQTQSQSDLSILKFHQISYKTLNGLLRFDLNFVDDGFFLENAYNLLLRPFEPYLLTFIIDQLKFLNFYQLKPKLILIYDESLLKIPFHLCKFEFNLEKYYLYELYEVSLFESLNGFNAFSNGLMNGDGINVTIEKCRFLNNFTDLDYLIDNFTNFKFKFLYINMKFNNFKNEDFNSLFNKMRMLINLKVAYSVLLKLNTNSMDSENKLFDHFLFSLVHMQQSQPPLTQNNSKQLDSIYSQLINEYRSKFSDKIPNCYLVGANIDLNQLTKEDVELNEQFIFYKNIVWSIVKFNACTNNNSLINLLTFMIENYLLQNETVKITTTLDSLVQRLNLIDNNANTELCLVFKCILVKLGFLFLNDNDMIKFPNFLNYYKKLDIIYKILKIFQNFSSNAIQNMVELSKTTAEELLRFLEQEYEESEIQHNLTYNINSDQINLFSSIFNSLKLVNSFEINKKDNKIRINSEFLNKFYYVIHILHDDNKDNFKFLINLLSESRILLNNDVQESVVISEERINVGGIRGGDDDDETSVYSSMSSVLGIQPKQAIIESVTKQQQPDIEFVNNNQNDSKFEYNKQIDVRDNAFDTDDDELDEQTLKTTPANQNDDKDVSTSSGSKKTEYTEELNKIIESSTTTSMSSQTPPSPNQPHKQLEPVMNEELNYTSEIYDNCMDIITTTGSYTGNEMSRFSGANKARRKQQVSNDESKWKCLIQYEEEEFINKLITTITTRTICEDTLTFENAIKRQNVPQDQHPSDTKTSGSRLKLINNVHFDDDDEDDDIDDEIIYRVDEDDDDDYEDVLNEFHANRDEITLKFINNSFI